MTSGMTEGMSGKTSGEMGGETSVLLQISDTHFGTERPEVVEALAALAARQRPDAVVLSGDITQRARTAQFRAAKAFVDRLGAPVVAIPGNHDIALFDLWSRFRRPYGRYAAAFGDTLEPVFSSPELLIVGVNTTRAWRHKHGEVSAPQVDRVARVLATASARQLRVVVVHQPLAVPEAGERMNLLRGHEAAVPAWAAAGADLVMGGHIHLPYTLALHGLARRLWVVQAGTAVSSRTRSGVPNSVNVVRWGPAGTPASPASTMYPALALPDEPTATAGACRIERWDFAPEGPGFVLAAVTTVEPQRG